MERNSMRSAMLPGRDPETPNALRRYADDMTFNTSIGSRAPFSDDYSRYQFANNPELDFPEYVSRPLNLRNLLNAGALRVTYPGTGKGDANIADEDNFSLVSLYNDLVGRQTATWPSHRRAGEFIDVLQRSQGPFLYAGKYNQLVDSARRLGLADEDIFMPAEKNR